MSGRPRCSARIGSMLTKYPTRPSRPGRVRPATGEPTMMSSWPAYRASKTWKAARRVVYRLAPFASPSATNASVNRRLQRVVTGAAPVAPEGRSRAVGREVEDRQRAGELPLPVGPEPFPFLAREHLVLPADEVGVARLRRRPCPRTSRPLFAVGPAQVVEEHRRREEVGDDVVEDQQDDVIGVGSPQQVDAEEWTVLQVEGAAGQIGQSAMVGRGVRPR